MQALDTTIAYYLCSIMVVLALIITFGAIRHGVKGKKGGKDTPSD
jgi:hypothetical protein